MSAHHARACAGATAREEVQVRKYQYAQRKFATKIIFPNLTLCKFARWANLHWANWYMRTCIGKKILDPDLVGNTVGNRRKRSKRTL